MSDDARSEPNVFPAGWTVTVILGIAGFAGLCVALIWLVYPAARDMPNKAAGFAPPGLETYPIEAFRSYEAAEQARLAGAGGRTPIEDAMAEVVQRGTLEARP
ncbi:hypothetical protein DC366_16490 [Pelagivirga sediminicola]|uniref:Uncharacterized protein n=1 Tax=Pelagivirga sediminicola TaxID=2170575 RepID=A0A2T7G389_9RHOB|nr:hypothetical protein [Pelagivirga sediminicola]PVA08897.1 hypothetical protein DC366_16490 [Pelagivirga sediminicola]